MAKPAASLKRPARSLQVDIADGLRDRLDQRIKAERRTLRAVVEAAISHYLDTVPLDSAPTVAVEQPKRGRPAGSKGK